MKTAGTRENSCKPGSNETKHDKFRVPINRKSLSECVKNYQYCAAYKKCIQIKQHRNPTRRAIGKNAVSRQQVKDSAVTLEETLKQEVLNRDQDMHTQKTNGN